MDEVRWLDEDEARAWRAFQLLQARLTARLARDLSAHSELSYQDYIVLVALTDQPDGQMRLFELAAQVGWEKSRASHQVTRMSQRGLVAKWKCGSDGRGSVVSVTGYGLQRITAAAPSHLEAVRRFFVDRLSAEELVQLTAVANTVLAAIAEEELRECGTEAEVCSSG